MKRRKKYSGKSYLVVFLFFLSFFASGCAMAPRTGDLATMQTPELINVAGKNIESVGVSQIEIEMKEKKVGNFHSTGLPFVPGIQTVSYNSLLKLSPESQEAIKRLIEDNLAEAGYTVVGREQLFVPSDIDKARFLIGGAITDSSWNGYNGFRGYQTIGSCKVEWQIYDTIRKEVIYKSMTEGKDWVQNSDGVGLTAKILNSALRNLMAQESFVAALSEASK